MYFPLSRIGDCSIRYYRHLYARIPLFDTDHCQARPLVVRVTSFRILNAPPPVALRTAFVAPASDANGCCQPQKEQTHEHLVRILISHHAHLARWSWISQFASCSRKTRPSTVVDVSQFHWHLQRVLKSCQAPISSFRVC